MYMGLLARARPGPLRHQLAPARRLRRRLAAGRGAARRRGGVRVQAPRGLRAVGDLAGRLVQPPGPARPRPGSVGTPIRGVEFELPRRGRPGTVADGEIGEIVIRGENVMKGYWNRPEATAEAMRGGWFHTGDLGHPRRRRLLLHRRPREGPDHPQRVQRLPARGRGGPLHPSRPSPRQPSSGPRRPCTARRSPRWCTLKDGASATDDELRDFVEGADRELQVPPLHPVRRRAQGSDRQDPQAGDQVRGQPAGARRRRRRLVVSAGGRPGRCSATQPDDLVPRCSASPTVSSTSATGALVGPRQARCRS